MATKEIFPKDCNINRRIAGIFDGAIDRFLLVKRAQNELIKIV